MFKMFLSQMEANVVDQLKAGSHILKLWGRAYEEFENCMQIIWVGTEA